MKHRLAHITWEQAARWLVPAAILGLMALALAHALLYRHYFIDDAYITYRYPKNLIEGNGFVFNPGERVEGTSAFFFALLLAVPMAMGADAHLSAQILGTAAFLGVVVLTVLLARALLSGWQRHVVSLGAGLLVAAAAPLARYAISGMELLVYTFFLVGGVYAYVRHHARGASRAWPVALGLAAITRPEGVAFFGLLLALDTVHDLARARQLGASARRALYHLAFFLIPFAPVVLFRLLYFGALMPNSVAAKGDFSTRLRGASLFQALRMLLEGDGQRYVRTFYERFGIGLALALVPLLLPGRRYLAGVMLALVMGCVAVVLWNNGDWMGHGRLLLPTFPLVVVLLALGLSAAYRLARRWTIAQAAATVVILAVLGLLADRWYYLRTEMPPRLAAHYLRTLGEAIAQVRQPDDVLATDTIGILPFYANVRTIDTLGLTDAHIARLKGKTDWVYILEQEPTFLHLNFVHDVKRLYQRPEFSRHRDSYYLLMDEFNRTSHQHKERPKWLLVRKDHPRLDELRQLLGASTVEPRSYVGSSQVR